MLSFDQEDTHTWRGITYVFEPYDDFAVSHWGDCWSGITRAAFGHDRYICVPRIRSDRDTIWIGAFRALGPCYAAHAASYLAPACMVQGHMQGWQSIDGIPWEIHMITDENAYEAALSAYQAAQSA